MRVSSLLRLGRLSPPTKTKRCTKAATEAYLKQTFAEGTVVVASCVCKLFGPPGAKTSMLTRRSEAPSTGSVAMVLDRNGRLWYCFYDTLERRLASFVEVKTSVVVDVVSPHEHYITSDIEMSHLKYHFQDAEVAKKFFVALAHVGCGFTLADHPGLDLTYRTIFGCFVHYPRSRSIGSDQTELVDRDVKRTQSLPASYRPKRPTPRSNNKSDEWLASCTLGQNLTDLVTKYWQASPLRSADSKTGAVSSATTPSSSAGNSTSTSVSDATADLPQTTASPLRTEKTDDLLPLLERGQDVQINRCVRLYLRVNDNACRTDLCTTDL